VVIDVPKGTVKALKTISEQPPLVSEVLQFLDVPALVAVRLGNRCWRDSVKARLPHALQEACPSAQFGNDSPFLQLLPLQCGVSLVRLIEDADTLRSLLANVCSTAEPDKVLKLASGYPGDPSLVVISALLAAMRDHESHDAIPCLACMGLVILMGSEERYKGIICDLGGVTTLVASVRKSGTARTAALETLQVLSDFHEDPDSFMLLMPGVRAVRNAMKKRVGKVLLESRLIAAIGSALSDLGADDMRVAMKLLYRLVGCPFWSSFSLPVEFYASALVDLHGTCPVPVLAAELQRSAGGHSDELHGEVRAVICMLLMIMR